MFYTLKINDNGTAIYNMIGNFLYFIVSSWFVQNNFGRWLLDTRKINYFLRVIFFSWKTFGHIGIFLYIFIFILIIDGKIIFQFIFKAHLPTSLSSIKSLPVSNQSGYESHLLQLLYHNHYSCPLINSYMGHIPDFYFSLHLLTVQAFGKLL